MKRWTSITLFALVLLLCSVGPVWKLYAQAIVGFTKVNVAPITTTSFTTATLTNGATYRFEITAVDASGETGPSNIVSGTVPVSGTHTGTLSWGAATGGTAPITYNVYSQVSLPLNPPGAVSLTIN